MPARKPHLGFFSLVAVTIVGNGCFVLLYKSIVLVRSLQPLFQDKQSVRGAVAMHDEDDDDDDDKHTLVSFCTRQQLRQGHWSDPDHNATAPYIPSVSWHRTCYGKSGDLQGYYQSSWIAPANATCQFDEWNQQEFCRLVENQTVTFIGDSITWQQFEALRFRIDDSIVLKNKPNTMVIQACANRTQLVYSRNNHILASGVLKVLDQYKPQTVLLNRGIWYQPDEQLVPTLQETLATLQTWYELHPDTVFVWRTTAPGVPACFNETAPNNDRSQMLQRVTHRTNNDDTDWYNSSAARSKFMWWEIPRQNALVERLLLQQEKTNASTTSTTTTTAGIDFEIIDGMELYMTRPDQRQSTHDRREGDCLHQCLPGPPDESNRVLQHILQRRRAAAAAGREE